MLSRSREQLSVVDLVLAPDLVTGPAGGGERWKHELLVRLVLVDSPPKIGHDPLAPDPSSTRLAFLRTRHARSTRAASAAALLGI